MQHTRGAGQVHEGSEDGQGQQRQLQAHDRVPGGESLPREERALGQRMYQCEWLFGDFYEARILIISYLILTDHWQCPGHPCGLHNHPPAGRHLPHGCFDPPEHRHRDRRA